MGTLQVTVDDHDNYVLRYLGDGGDQLKAYRFLGEDADAQLQGVRLLASAMQDGSPDVLSARLPELVDLDVENWRNGAADAVRMLFGESNWFSFLEEPAYVASTSLLDDLAEVAVYLLDALAAL